MTGWDTTIRGGWNRTLWEVQVMSAGLPDGVVATALALSATADGNGAAAPGMPRLAEISECTVSGVGHRITRLIVTGFAVRDGRALIARDDRWKHKSMIRYQLVIPPIADVGQWIRGPGGGFG